MKLEIDISRKNLRNLERVAKRNHRTVNQEVLVSVLSHIINQIALHPTK